MTGYAWFNLVLALVLCPIGLLLAPSRRARGTALRTAAVMTLMAFPWDFVAISLNAWTYSEAGLRIYVVPQNDLVFIFVCTFFSASLMTSKQLRHGFGPTEGQPKAKDRSENAPCGDVR